jgi:hypothetical protein
VLQDLPGEHQVEGLPFEFVGGDVVAAHLQVGGRDGLEELRLQVGGPGLPKMRP